MNLFVSPLEAGWFIVVLVTFVLTVVALIDARRDLAVAEKDRAVRRAARILTASGNVRRETLRLLVQGLLLGIIVPSLFRGPPEVMLTLPVLMLIAIPLILFTSTVLDARDRGRLSAILIGTILTDSDLVALESSMQENIELTRNASKDAKAAYHEANSVNGKIATLTDLVKGKADKQEGE